MARYPAGQTQEMRTARNGSWHPVEALEMPNQIDGYLRHRDHGRTHSNTPPEPEIQQRRLVHALNAHFSNGAVAEKLT